VSLYLKITTHNIPTSMIIIVKDFDQLYFTQI